MIASTPSIFSGHWKPSFHAPWESCQPWQYSPLAFTSMITRRRVTITVTYIGKPPPHILGQVERGRTPAHWHRQIEGLSLPASTSPGEGSDAVGRCGAGTWGGEAREQQTAEELSFVRGIPCVIPISKSGSAVWVIIQELYDKNKQKKDAVESETLTEMIQPLASLILQLLKTRTKWSPRQRGCSCLLLELGRTETNTCSLVIHVTPETPRRQPRAQG